MLDNTIASSVVATLTEVGAIGAALGGLRGDHVRAVTLVSVKSIYGHTEGAAGMLLP